MPKHTSSNKLTLQEEAQSYALIAGFITFFIAYLAAEAVLALKPHPYHWITALGTTAALGVATYFITLWRLKRNRPRQ